MGPKKEKKKGKTGKVAKAKSKDVKEAHARSKKSPPKSSKMTIEQEQLPEIISDTIVEYLHEVDGDSPIDLEWSTFFKIRAESIEWTNWDLAPDTLTLTNTAYNVVLTGTWPPGMTPSVAKGPMTAKYDFAQVHFHWGLDSTTGSDHAVSGFQLPFEIHIVFYKASCGSLAEAKKDEDGVVFFCYLYKISEQDNKAIQMVTDNIKEVTYAHTTKDLDPVPLGTLFAPVTDDFIAYLGQMKYKTVHGVTFVISRETHFLSENQLAGFRNLKDRHENPMILNARTVESYGGRYVFVMNPKNTAVTSVLLAAAPSSPAKPSYTPASSASSKKSSKTKKSTDTKGKILGRKRPSKKSRKSRKSKKSTKSKKSSKKKSKAGKKKLSKKPKTKSRK